MGKLRSGDKDAPDSPNVFSHNNKTYSTTDIQKYNVLYCYAQNA